MTSLININDELTRCINIRYSLIILFLDATLYGYANRIYRSVKDIMTLYALEKALYNAVYYGFDETEINNLIYKIREYLGILNYDSKVDYFLLKYPSLECPTEIDGIYAEPCTPAPVSPEIPKSGIIENTYWNTQDLSDDIVADGQTTITGLNFDISTIDIDTVLLTVQGDDSFYTISGEGYHIVGTTLYWHSFYDLKVGMNVVIKWRTE